MKSAKKLFTLKFAKPDEGALFFSVFIIPRIKTIEVADTNLSQLMENVKKEDWKSMSGPVFNR